MRVISGKRRGASLTAPDGQKTRPTADRTREMIFNILDGGRHGNPLEVDLIIDGFAGSGAMGLEAWSRGAKRVILIDQDASALQAIKANISKLGAGEECGAVSRNLLSALSWPFGQAGLIFLDPPWQKSANDPDASMIALDHLRMAGGIADDALIVIEHDHRFPPQPPFAFDIVDQRKAGKAGVCFLRYRSDRVKPDAGC
ncbi:MAG: RsmD family RNA methyltransferase [Candidatus Puniceispirillales bacterium]